MKIRAGYVLEPSRGGADVTLTATDRTTPRRQSRRSHSPQSSPPLKWFGGSSTNTRSQLNRCQI